MNHRAKQNIDLLLLSEDQFTVMAAHTLHWVAAVDSPTPFSKFAALLFGSVRAEDNVFRGDPKCLQETYPELVGAPYVQYLGDSYAQLRAIFNWRRGGMLLCEPCLQYWDRHFLSSRFRP